MTPTTREALRQVDEEFDRLCALLEGLSAEEREREVFGEGVGWRIRDLPAHFAFWKRISAALMAKILVTGVLPESGKLRVYLGIDDRTVDELNEARRLRWHELPFGDGMAELRRAHITARTLLEQLPPQLLYTPDGEPHVFWVQPNVRHLRQHTEHINAATKEATSA